MPAPPWTVAPKRRKGPFPTSAACCCFSTQPTGEKSSPLHTCALAHTRGPARPMPPCSRILPHPRAAAAPCASSQVTPAAGTCPAAPPRTVRAQTRTLPPPQHPFSLSPPACFLGFCPYFIRQKQPPSLHLPSRSRSQLFFLLFSASYYPGAKNNKEFTALDLELGQAQRSSFVLCQQITRWLILGFPCISASPFPWGHSIGILARLASAARDAASWSRKRDETCHTGMGEQGGV